MEFASARPQHNLPPCRFRRTLSVGQRPSQGSRREWNVAVAPAPAASARAPGAGRHTHRATFHQAPAAPMARSHLSPSTTRASDDHETKGVTIWPVRRPRLIAQFNRVPRRAYGSRVAPARSDRICPTLSGGTCPPRLHTSKRSERNNVCRQSTGGTTPKRDRRSVVRYPDAF